MRYRKTARNFNPDVAGLAKVTIAEVEEIVDEIPPEKIHTPGLYVNRIYKGESFLKRVERLKLHDENASKQIPPKGSREEKRYKIARRACHEVKPGMYCNLGVGIPTLVPVHL